MKGTKSEKYVAKPQKGSMHNYGVAVDVTIVDAIAIVAFLKLMHFYIWI